MKWEQTHLGQVEKTGLCMNKKASQVI